MRRRLTAIATLTAVMAGATACAGAEPATSEEGGVTVSIGFSAWPGWFPWQVTLEQGFFEANDVDVEMVWFDDYLRSLEALSTGAVDANSQTLNDTLISISGGAAQTIVLVNDNSTGNDQIIVSDGIASVDDLAGKTIAVEAGAVSQFLLALVLDDAGLSFADVTIVELAVAEAAAAFKAEQVDAVAAYAPFTTTALERPGSTVLATSAEFPGAIPDHLTFDASFVEEHPAEVQKVVQAWFDTLAWIAENRDEAVAIMAERAGVSIEDYESYDSGTTIFDKADNLAAFSPGDSPAHLDHMAAQIADFIVEVGLVEETPSLEGLFDSTFVEAANA